MASFCRQCAKDHGFDAPGDFKGMTSWWDWLILRRATTIICEGCSGSQVDPLGNCVTNCNLHHWGKLFWPKIWWNG